MWQQEVRVGSGLLARNTLLNFAAQALSIAIGLIAMPFVVHGLGAARFGVLSLAWAVLGYFTVFDLGLGRATTKFVAEAIGSGQYYTVPLVVWTAISGQFLFGVAGGLILVMLAPLLAGSVLRVPSPMLGEASASFRALAPIVPIALLSSSLSGILQAWQRFDLVNAVQVPITACSYLLPVLGTALGMSLPGIIALILVSRAAGLIVLAGLCLALFPALRMPSASATMFPSLLAFGGWLTVSAVVEPILTNLERFLVGSVASVAAVAYYTVPFEAVTRLSIIPQSLTTSLFPAFSTVDSAGDRRRLAILFARPLKYVIVAVGPMVVAVVVFASDILRLWLGEGFALRSSAVMQVLAVGVLANSVGQVPYALLQGVGRPDITAKIHLVEVPFYAGVAWLLVHRSGLAGAALAWTLRVSVDAVLLLAASFRLVHLPARSLLVGHGVVLSTLAVAALLGVSFAAGLAAPHAPLGRLCLFAFSLAAFAWTVWYHAMDESDRRIVTRLVRSPAGHLERY